MQTPGFESAAEKSEHGNALQTVRSGQTDLTKTLQEENERLRQSAQAAPAQIAELTPTPVKKSAQLHCAAWAFERTEALPLDMRSVAFSLISISALLLPLFSPPSSSFRAGSASPRA
ncbi:hypothetical protein FMUND_7629 [Fusarium mundagurra]|uniref:Uncharacterized protein n=1 Tax=Fusarium mundagurra TaxID=1567541 RepID=A0A8H5YMD4_9HYPO|nr:hypothetical protein FMUND_7629 [Fusarium mundagurra]